MLTKVRLHANCSCCYNSECNQSMRLYPLVYFLFPFNVSQYVGEISHHDLQSIHYSVICRKCFKSWCGFKHRLWKCILCDWYTVNWKHFRNYFRPDLLFVIVIKHIYIFIHLAYSFPEHFSKQRNASGHMG